MLRRSGLLPLPDSPLESLRHVGRRRTTVVWPASATTSPALTAALPVSPATVFDDVSVALLVSENPLVCDGEQSPLSLTVDFSDIQLADVGGDDASVQPVVATLVDVSSAALWALESESWCWPLVGNRMGKLSTWHFGRMRSARWRGR